MENFDRVIPVSVNIDEIKCDTFFNSEIITHPINEITFGTIRPDAELIKTYSYDKYLVADEGLTVPAYTTTATTILGATNLGTIDIDLDKYHYYMITRHISIPEYSITTLAKGRVEYLVQTHLYEYSSIPANEFSTLINPSKKITSVTNAWNVSGYFYRLLYWSSGSAIALYNSVGYGVYQANNTPTISGNVMTVRSPSLSIRGSTTYYVNTFMNATTDIRYQYVIDIYRAPNDNMNLDGWGTEQNMFHVIDCMNTPNHKLS